MKVHLSWICWNNIGKLYYTRQIFELSLRLFYFICKGENQRIWTRVDRWSNEHCVGYWKILLIAMFSWVLFFCTHLLFTFLDKVILHLCLANLNSRGQKQLSFHTKKLWKLLNPKSFFWKRFGQGHFPHDCKIWAGSDEKWMSSLQKTVIF